MSLKPIPLENPVQFRKNKSFNPGNKIKKNGNGKDGSLKNICLRLVHFINRGSRFTYQQVDDLILTMHRSILSLQKKKQEIMRNKQRRGRRH